MMKPPRHVIELSGWNEGAPFDLPGPFRRTARHSRRTISIREKGPGALFQPRSTPVKPFEEQGPWPASRPWSWGISLALLLAVIPPARGQATNAAAPPAADSRTNAPSRMDFSTFRIISDRNIFNSSRSGRSSRSGGDTPRPAKVDSFTLVGTMAYEKGWFAFFEGSGAEFKKVLKSDGIIAGYKIVDIAPGNVKLARDGKELELRVGTQMRRQEEGDWEQSAQAGSYSGSGRLESSSKSDSSSPAASGSSGDDNEVLKRLMQKREAEDNK